MLITVDPDSSVAPFEQVRTQIIELVRGGALPVGLRLPTIRKLAGDLNLAANTVGRAYRELEADGIIETRGRHGTFIAAAGDAVRREAATAAAAYVVRARRLGLSRESALAAIETALSAAYTDAGTFGGGPL